MTRIVVAIVVVLTVLLAIGMVPTAAAGDRSVGGSLYVDHHETVGDTTFVGGEATIAGTVDGDLTVVAGSVDLASTGTVTGDLTVVGGTVSLRGTIDGSVDLTSGTAMVAETASIGGDLTVVSGRLSIAGTIGGSVLAGVDSLTVHPESTVHGDLRYAEDATATIDDTATIGGDVVADPDLDRGGHRVASVSDVGPIGLDGVWRVYVVGFWLLFGAVILTIAPRFGDDVLAEVAGGPWRTLGVGFVSLFFVPVIFLALALTIVGIPLALLGFLFLFLLVAVAVVMGRYAIGAWLLSRAGFNHRYLALFLGVVGMAFIDRIPYLGAWINFVVFLLGFGAVLLLLGRWIRSYRSPATPVRPTAGDP